MSCSVLGRIALFGVSAWTVAGCAALTAPPSEDVAASSQPAKPGSQVLVVSPSASGLALQAAPSLTLTRPGAAPPAEPAAPPSRAPAPSASVRFGTGMPGTCGATPTMQLGAAHVLLAYQGAEGAPPTITRSKREAQEEARQVMRRLRQGASFEALAKELSDDRSSAEKGGGLGVVTLESLPKTLGDTVYSLSPGEISPFVTETPRGFHVVKRTE